jgi:RNA polymerase sigma factor (sigma-70 family)
MSQHGGTTGMARAPARRDSRQRAKPQLSQTVPFPVPVRSAPRRDLSAYSTQDLAALAFSGDSVAWDTLYSRCVGNLAGITLSLDLGFDEDEAMDLAQATMVRAWTYRHRFDQARSFWVWIRIILDRLAHNEIRRTRRRARIHVDELAPAAMANTLAAGSTLEALIENEEAEDRRRVLALAMQRLSSGDRELLTAYAEGERLVLLAEKIRVNESTVRGRLFRAKRRLAEAYRAVLDLQQGRPRITESHR